jgi:hypothetical protein
MRLYLLRVRLNQSGEKGHSMTTEIKSMTPRRWAKFRRIVLPGTEVRNMNCSKPWSGVLLENYPCAAEERLDRECEKLRYYRLNLNQLHKKPSLRVQDYETIHPHIVFACWPTVQYSVQGQWLSMSEILRLKPSKSDRV